MFSIAVPLWWCAMMFVLSLTYGLRYNFTEKEVTPSERPTTAPSTPFLQKIANWFLEGTIWKIALVVAGGLLIIALIILIIYRVRKRRMSKETITETRMDISVPKDGTFMGSQSADVLLTAETKECTSTTKPRLKSKMMKSFKKDDKHEGNNQRDSFSSRSQSTASYHYGEEMTKIHSTGSLSLRSPNNTHAQSKDEVVYANQSIVSLKRQAQPVYQNETAQSGKVDEVIYQNASASGAPLCHGYVNSRSTLKQQKGYRDSHNDLEYAAVSH